MDATFIAGAISAALNLDDSQFSTACQVAQQAVDKLGEKTAANSANIQKMGTEFAVAGAAITAALTAIALKTVDVEHEFAHMSEKTGISTEDLSSLSLAANKSGMDIEGLVHGMRFLAVQMVATAKTTGDEGGILGALGVKVKDTQGNLLGMNDVLFQVADKFAGMSDGALKADLAVKLFGRSGLDMIPLLNMGGKGLQENADLAAKFGIVVGKDAAGAAVKFEESMQDMKAASEGLGRVIGEALMPTIKTIIGGMTDAFTAAKNWAKANPELSQALVSVGLAIGGILTVAGGLMLTIPKLVSSFQAFASVLSITAAELALSLAGLIAIAAAAMYAYQLVTSLTNATNQATEADYNAYEANKKQGQTMREVGDAAGLTRAQFVQLTEKYQGNYAAMMQAVRAGKEGVAMQTALTTEGKKLAAAHDLITKAAKDQDEKMRKLLESMGKTTAATKTLKEELQLTFIADIAEKIKKIEEALIKYKGQLAPDSEKKLREELEKLSTEYGIATGKLTPLTQVHRDMADVLKKAPGEYQAAQAWSDRYNEELKEMGAMTIPQIKEATREFIEQQRILTELFHAGQLTGEEYRIKMDEIQQKIRDLGTKTLPATQAAVDDFSKAWAQMVTDMAKGFSDAVIKMTGITDMFKYKIQEFDKSAQFAYFKKALDDVKKSLSAALTAIESAAAAATDALDKEYRTKRDAEEDSYNKQKEYINANIKDATQRKEMLDALEIQHRNATEALDDQEQAAKKAIADKEAADKVAAEGAAQKEIDRIQADADKTKEWYEKREQERQGSLWNSVKNIFANAVATMLTTWLTSLVTPLLTSIVGSLLPKIAAIGTTTASSLATAGGAATGLAGTVAGVFTSIASIITTLATAVASAITIIATGIATALVTLATAIASAATILAAAAVALITVGALAIALYAAFKIVGGIIDSIFGSAGSKEEKTLQAINAHLVDIRAWTISDMVPQMNYLTQVCELTRDYTQQTKDLSFGFRDQFNEMIGKLASIDENISNLRGASTGAISDRTELMVLHGTAQDKEYVLRESQLAQVAGSGGGRNAPLEFRFEQGGTPLKITETVKGIIVRLIPELTKKELLLVHPAAVRTF